MSVALAELVAAFPADLWHGPPPTLPQVRVAGLCYDSRRAQPGDLFFALPGVRVDGARFAGEAAGRGAAAVVTEADVRVPEPCPRLRVRSARQALALCAALFHGQPSRRLRVTAITGTDGKTSSVWFTRHILGSGGRAAVALGTLGILDAGGRVRAWSGATATEEIARTWQPTTPEAPLFQATLAQLASEGVHDAVCEVSSHALAQERTYGTQFAAVALTHIAADHLDFHGSSAAYRAAKMRLFDRATRGGPLEEEAVLEVLNIDDDLGREAAQRSTGQSLTYGVSAVARVRRISADETTAGIRLGVSFDGQRQELATPLRGQFHAANLLTAAAITYGLGMRPPAIAAALTHVPAVPGRFEEIHAGQDFTVIVDYAHTTDGLRSLLQAARQLTDGRLILVFGCGGDRDPSKRAEMGLVAGRLADHVLVTSDNPRSEPPDAIAAEILRGLREGQAGWEVELDRGEALARGVALARKGDILVAAGKGAESQQIHADRIERLDDRDLLRALLER